MGLLSGLARFGLGNLENMEIYEEEKPENTEADKAVQKVVHEADFLFDKSYTCPICGREFKERTIRTGKAKLIGSDRDLRPRYEHIELLKYDIIMCPVCGYAALGRFFPYVTPLQAKNIKDKIAIHFTSQDEAKDVYTYDDALERYRMALANAVVKQAKTSEKAYICLKTAWLLRSKAEHLDKELPDYKAQKKQCEEEEKEFLRNALGGFLSARQSESFPMCGLEQATVEYLIAVTAMRFEKYDVTSSMISSILQLTSNPRIKDRARELKKIVLENIREKKTAAE